MATAYTLLYVTDDVIYTGLYTYHSELSNPLYCTYLLRVPTAWALNLHPRTKRISSGIRLQLMSEVGSVDFKYHNHGKRSYCPFVWRSDFVQGSPSSPSGEVSKAAGTWERLEDVGYRVRLAWAGDTPSRVKSDRRPGNGGGLVDLGHPVVSESGGFTPRRGGDVLPSSIGADARSTSPRGGYAAGFSSGRKPLVMPGSYDGSMSLMEYSSNFMLVTQVNGWTSQEAALYLGVSLSGPARRLLSGVDLGAADGLERLIAALERGFQPRNQEAIYRAQLARQQQKGESISQLSDAVEQLMKQAYPSADYGTLDELSRDYFTAALASNDHRQGVHQSRPTSYQAAVAVAQHAEAYFCAEEERGIHLLHTMADLERVVGPSSGHVAGPPSVAASGANGSRSSGDRMLRQILEKLEQFTSQVPHQRPAPPQSQERRC